MKQLGDLLRARRTGPVDPVLAAAVVGLVGFGVIMVYSASLVEAITVYRDPQHFLKRLHLNLLVVDDDAVEVEEDGFDHLGWVFISSNSFGKRSLSNTSRRRNTSASDSSFFRFTW